MAYDIFSLLIVSQWQMLKIRHILLTILVICILGSSSSWAYDDHAVSIDVAHQHHHADEQSTADESLKDHCGHLSAHIVGLFSEICFKFNNAHLHVQPEASERFVSFVPLLYLRPPSI